MDKSSESNYETMMEVVDSSSFNNAELDLNVSLSEESKGGIRYEVILDEPKSSVSTPKVSTPTPKELTAEVIDLKIKAAERRRLSLESERIAAINGKLRRVSEAAKKREAFIMSTKENLDHKMETSTENRETAISGLKSKLSNHNNHFKEIKQNLETAKSAYKLEIEAKLELAEKNRIKALNDKLESLKKHDEKIELVRAKRNSAIIGSSESTTPIENCVTMNDVSTETN